MRSGASSRGTILPVLRAPVAAELPTEEGKLATVPFSNLVGWTGLAGAQDPEPHVKLRAILRSSFPLGVYVDEQRTCCAQVMQDRLEPGLTEAGVSETVSRSEPGDRKVGGLRHFWPSVGE